jgi:hypothetical protein
LKGIDRLFSRQLRPVAWRSRRLGAELMRRIFEFDVLQCAKCGGQMLMLDVVLPPDATRELLESLQLPTRAPPLEPAVFDDPHAA